MQDGGFACFFEKRLGVLFFQLVNLLAQALQEAHGRPSVEASGEAPLFQRIGEFPTAVDPEFTMSDDAKRVDRAGAPFLQRYVPFWLATMIDRMMVSALVALPLLIPLMRFAPQIYRWRVRRRILHWYGALKALEAGSRVTASGGERTEKLAELDRIQGMGEMKTERFGAAFLAVLRGE